MNFSRSANTPSPALALSLALLAGLTACGGGANTESATAAPADTSAMVSTPAPDASSADSTVAAIAQAEVQPTYHMAPALLDEPSSVDIGGTNVSAHAAPRSFDVDPSVADIDTKRLTTQTLTQRLAGSGRARVASANGASTTPLATALTGAVFSPAQIRAAYGLPALPAVGAAITPAVAASLGAGQTIYLLDAFHDASALSDLNIFSTRFGLPTCSNVAVGPSTALPLAKPPAACTFSAVYSSAFGTMTATVPAYNGTWTPESKLDVQWAHAIAPLARIVLIEMPNAMSNNILDGNTLAAKLGAGVVSMSFGLAEAGWVPTTDYVFTKPGMTYVAAAGDAGSQVLWPAVSPNVVAVGGTGLNWSGSGTRREAAWARGGGGLSAYEALPAWQSGVSAAGGGALTRRAVPDVAFNANPMTGEYVALTLPGASTTTWAAYGGTSIAAPQWAGVIAVANAMRVASSKTVLGDIHTLLYKSIAEVPGSYAAAFGDIVDGANGTCATCTAGVGFDQTTGWGTPTATALLPLLTGGAAVQSAPAAPSPVVPGGSFVGSAVTALSQSLGVTVPSGTTTSYALSGAPSGLGVDSTGTLKWAAPVAGTYTFSAIATTSAGKSASGTYALKVIPGTAPTISTATLTGAVGNAFSASLASTNPNGGTLSYTVSGAPAGLAASTSGALSWAAPVAGAYTLTLRVADSYGYASTKAVPLTIATGNHAPTLASATLAEKAGTSFAVRVYAQDADGDALTYTATGVPSGAMMLSPGILTWASPVKGSYALTVTVRDTHGAAASAVVNLIVS